MLGTFPKDFPKLQLPLGIFPSGNYPNVQFPKRQPPKSVLVAALSPQRIIFSSLAPSPSAAALGPIAAFGASESLNNLWEVAACEIATWEIVTWEVGLAKMP